MKKSCLAKIFAVFAVLGLTSVLAHAQISLISTGAVWKYLDDGSDQGTAWTALPSSFDDSAWASGPAELGYGDGDEATVVGYGGVDTNKYITTYFRHTFNLADPGSITRLTIGLRRDDGAIVYLNGNEVFRSNMPQGPVDYLTFAGNNTGSETALRYADAPAGLLVTGDNTVAVEVHQVNLTSSDLSFDLELIGNAAIVPPTIDILSPTNNEVVSSPSPVTFDITVDANDADGYITKVEFFDGVIKIGESTTDPFTFTWIGASAGAHTLTAVATDSTLPTGQTATSTPVDITVTEMGTFIVQRGSVWSYLDDGSDQGTAWQALGFPDGGWASGPAELGYGDGDEATVVGYGPDPDNKYITTYFRHKFNMPSVAGITALQLEVRHDDGVVVYINENEVFRDDLPTGAIDYLTEAGLADENEEDLVCVSPSVLQAGDNIIAVEIHQDNGQSSDISFDLGLLANVPQVAPTISITSPTNGQSFINPPDILIQADAADEDCGVAQVEFFVDNVSVGVVTAAPWEIAYVETVSGQHTLTATVTDTSGLQATSTPVTIDVLIQGTALITAGSDWKYLDDGSDQGTAWTALPPTFDDSTWASGPAELGYGDGDEATVVSFGPESTNKYVTTYFRHTFNVADPGSISRLLLEVVRDDGVVVYLNGTEVARSHMPAGVIDYLTSASDPAVGGADESTFYKFPVDAGLLQTGNNVVAAEIHQNIGGSGYVTSSDISFNLVLVAGLPATPPTVAITAPTDGTVLNGAPRDEPIQATASDLDGVVTLVEFYVDGAKVDEDATQYNSAATYNGTALGLAVGQHILTAVATDNSGLMATSAPVTITVNSDPIFVQQNSVWKYLDNGTDQTSISPNFTDAFDYDDNSWAEGPGILGYGTIDNGPPDTTVGYGPDANNKYATTYFRRRFSTVGVDVGSLTNIQLLLMRDDAAAVYINGEMVLADNFGIAPPFAYNAYSGGGAVGGADERTYFPFLLGQNAIDALFPNYPDNLIAVEIHQDNGGSSDISFDLQMIGLLEAVVEGPTLHISLLSNGDVEINWTGAGFSLQQAFAPEGTYNTIAPAVTSGPYVIAKEDLLAGGVFFRLIQTP